MLAALALLATPASAATLPQWTGPGDRGCYGRCPVEWALEQLPEATRAEVVTAMRRAPVPVLVRDGDYLSLMTYHAGGPMAQHGLVAVLDAPEPASGWCIDGGCFVQVHGCANWAFVAGSLGTVLGGNETTGARVAFHSRAVAPALFAFAAGSGRIEPALFTSGATVGAWAGENPDTIPPVPLPAPFWLLLSALGALIALRRGAGPGRRPLGASVSLSPAGPSGPALFRGRG